MDAEYAISCAVEMGFLTPLEIAVLGAHPLANMLVRNVYRGDSITPINTPVTVLEQTTSMSLISGSTAFLPSTNSTHSLGFNRAPSAAEVGGLLYELYRESPAPMRKLCNEIAKVHYNKHMKSIKTRMQTLAVELLDGGNRNYARMLADSEGNSDVNKRSVLKTNAYKAAANRVHDQRSDILSEIEFDLTPYQTIVDTYMIEFRDGVERAIHSMRTFNPTTKKEYKASESMAKRAIKRATKFFERQGKSKMLNLFVSAGAVEVFHPKSDLKFVLKRRQGVLSGSMKHAVGWSNILFSVYTKTDVHISDLCVYIKDTPILDQLLSMTLMIEAGLENEFLEKGNIRAANYDINLEDYPNLNTTYLQKLKKSHEYARKDSGVREVADRVAGYDPYRQNLRGRRIERLMPAYETQIAADFVELTDEEGHYNELVGNFNHWRVLGETIHREFAALRTTTTSITFQTV